MNEIDVISVIMAVLIIVCFTIMYMLAVVAFEYVTDLYEELNFTNSENKKLLDTIDQGLLVFRGNGHWQSSQTSKSVMFCNQRARKLLNQYLSGDLFTKKAFRPSQEESEGA